MASLPCAVGQQDGEFGADDQPQGRTYVGVATPTPTERKIESRPAILAQERFVEELIQIFSVVLVESIILVKSNRVQICDPGESASN